MPVRPSTCGMISSMPTKNTKVRAKEITAETSPLEKAVNREEAKIILMPITKKLAAYRKPLHGDLIHRGAGIRKQDQTGPDQEPCPQQIAPREHARITHRQIRTIRRSWPVSSAPYL